MRIHPSHMVCILRVRGKLQGAGRTPSVLASLLQLLSFELQFWANKLQYCSTRKKRVEDRGLSSARWNVETAQENLPKKNKCVYACMCVHKPFIKLSNLLKSFHFKKLQIKLTFTCQHPEKVITIYIHIHISFIQMVLHTVSCNLMLFFSPCL